MEHKPKRRTRERILEASLLLFNAEGEPNVTLAAIADELNISQGNLYYHFKDKNAIVQALFDDYRRDMAEIFEVPDDRPVDIDDMWLFLHLVFERIWRYRFLYRDLVNLLGRYEYLATHFKKVMGAIATVLAKLCAGLVDSGQMIAGKIEVETLAVNMTVIATYWLSFQFVRDPANGMHSADLGSCVHQVMSLITPYLLGDSRQLAERLSANYL